MIAAMWFQDLFNYDFSVIGMDAARMAMFPGEISFCAYNSAGWRQVMEHVYQTASLAEWHRSRGRHRIYTNGAFIPALALALADSWYAANRGTSRRRSHRKRKQSAFTIAGSIPEGATQARPTG